MNVRQKIPHDVTECHILDTVKNPEEVARRVVEDAAPGAVVLDLSAGQLNAPHRPHRHIPSEALDKITWINGQLFAPEVGDASRDAYLNWLSDAASKPIAHGASIKEWFTYKSDNDISLWWFTSVSLKHAIHRPHRWFFYQVYVLKNITEACKSSNIRAKVWYEKEKPKLLVETAKNIFQNIKEKKFRKVKKERYNIKDNFKKIGNYKIGEAILSLMYMIKDVYLSIKQFHRVIKNSKKVEERPKKSDEVKSINDRIFLINTLFPSSWSQVPESMGKEYDEHDHYFGDAPQRIEKLGYPTGWLAPVTLYENKSQKWKQVKKRQQIRDATPWMRLSLSTIGKLIFQQVKWSIYYIYLFIIRDVSNKWKYNGISVGHWIKQSYDRVWMSWDIPIVEQYRTVLNDLEPDAILYRNEFGRSGRRLSAAAKGRTRLIGVQHGMISRDHTEYHWSQNDIQDPSEENHPDHVHFVPVPDRISVFGTHYVDQFQEWGYPEEIPVPIGGLRHDMLVEHYGLRQPTESRSTQKASLRNEYHLPSDRRILLLCTGSKRSAPTWFEMVVKGLRQQSLDVFVAVKLHQYHGGEKGVHRVAKKYQFNDYKTYTEDVYPLMEASDVLVSGASTTVLEGNLFNMDCIAICATMEYETYPFRRDGLAVLSEDSKSMADALNRTFSGGESCVDNSRLSRHLRNVNGAATPRLADLLG